MLLIRLVMAILLVVSLNAQCRMSGLGCEDINQLCSKQSVPISGIYYQCDRYCSCSRVAMEETQ